MTVLVTKAECPYQSYLDFCSTCDTEDNALLVVVFSFQQHWLDNQPVDLVALYWFTNGTVRYGVVQDQNPSLEIWETPPVVIEPTLSRWLADHNTQLFGLNDSLPLQSVSISKPWGKEIWYTGVEKRGVACFGNDDCRVPIPYLLEVMPTILGQAEDRSLVLLKILDPLSEEVFGDLYFELHREKQEVYVVTHIDTKAWPDGIGHMRMGFDPKKTEEIGNDAVFRQQFLQQVLAYRKIRFQIDGLLDEKRRQQGYALNAEVPVEQLKQWLAEIPSSLTEDEKKLRQSMESYFGNLPLKSGDVVKVPLNVPHSLQHGVRTIEFQTPVYERRILAFCQKVLTQNKWDTEQGVEEMEIAPPSIPELTILEQEKGLCVEQVVEFSDFEVQRITLSAPSTYRLASNVYQLLIVIEGSLIAGKQPIGKEQAILVPAKPAEVLIETDASEQATFLVAIPKIHPLI